MGNGQSEQKIDYILLLSMLFGLFIISHLTVYGGSGQYETSDPFYFVGLVIMTGVALFDGESFLFQTIIMVLDWVTFFLCHIPYSVRC